MRRAIKNTLAPLCLAFALTLPGSSAADENKAWMVQNQADMDAASKANDLAALEKIYRSGAEKGITVAQFLLAGFYYQGPHEDHAEAMKWFRKAADAHNNKVSPEAEFFIGEMHARGKGVPKDTSKARKWRLLSAEHGEALAMCEAAGYYSSGKGVPQDYVLAHMWYNLCGSTDITSGVAKMYRADLENKMSPSQITEAQKLAREWKPKPYGSSWLPWD
jgi:TPR repeat protein